MANEKYWSYQPSYTPGYGELPAGCFNGVEADWYKLSPGMRREIVRSFERKK